MIWSTPLSTSSVTRSSSDVERLVVSLFLTLLFLSVQWGFRLVQAICLFSHCTAACTSPLVPADCIDFSGGVVDL